MSDEVQARLASLLTILVGAYVALSPLWTAMSHEVMISAIVTGVIVTAASIWQFFSKATFPTWINAVAAIWLIVGVLTLGTYTFATWSQILAGAAVFLLAGWDGAEVAHYNHDHFRSGSHI